MVPTRPRRRRGRVAGQSIVEFALIAPLLMAILLGTTDLGAAYFHDVQVVAASRAGARLGVQSSILPIGDDIRQEPNSGVPDTPAVWGLAAYGQADDYCVTPAGQQACGDPQGCVATSSFWTTPASTSPATTALPVACFAVQTCRAGAASGPPFTCTPSGTWNTRPAAGTDDVLIVRVTYRYTPVTPYAASFAGGSGGSFYLTYDSYAQELY